MSKTKVVIISVAIGAVGLIAAALIVVFGLNNRQTPSQSYDPPPEPQYTQAQYYEPQQTAPSPVYYEPAPTAPAATMPPQTAPPATAAPVPITPDPAPASGGWAVEVWKEGNPPPIGVAFFTDYDKALAWSKSPTQGWRAGSGPISYNGDKVAYLVQFGLSDPSTYNPVEITP